MIIAFPKIFSIGTDYIRDVFKDGPVEVTEKIDGSQFAFGKIDGELVMRSKGKVLIRHAPEKMFMRACAYVESIEHLLPEGLAFYCEYLQTPRHNVLKYDRVPHNHLMLFGVRHVRGDSFLASAGSRAFLDYAERLGIEPVPHIGDIEIKNPVVLAELLDRESVLGGAKIEGFVVKNYNRQFLLGGQPMPLMAGKYVSEAFKEVHRSSWKGEHTGKGRLETFMDSFCTEARWHKAVQHLREAGKLINDPKDIGLLVKEVHRDLAEEEKEAIKNWLFLNFIGDINRAAVKGLPEWYKEQLFAKVFEEAEA